MFRHKKFILTVITFLSLLLTGCELESPPDVNLKVTSGGYIQIDLQTIYDTAEGDVTFQLTSLPTQGEASISGSLISYTAPRDFTGSVSYTYSYTLNNNESPSGTIEVTVIECPTEVDSDGNCLAFNMKSEKSLYNMIPDEKIPITWSLNYAGQQLPAELSISQEVEVIRGDQSGISINTPLPNTVEVTEPFSSNTLATEISANQVGLYLVKTTVFLEETGERYEDSMYIKVELQSEVLKIFKPSIYPDAIVANEITEVRFNVSTAIGNKNIPAQVVISGDIELTLNDEGVNGDLIAGDSNFSSSLPIDASQLAEGECLNFKAELIQSGIHKSSPTEEVCVSAYPLNSSPNDMSLTLTDPENGTSYSANEILVTFRDYTKKTEIDAIVESIGAIVVRWSHSPDYYLLRLSVPATSHDNMQEILNTLLSNTLVKSASLNIVVSGADIKKKSPMMSFLSFKMD